MTETTAGLSAKRRIFCNTCKNETNHSCQAEYELKASHGLERGFMLGEVWVYRIWTCNGCDSVTLEQSYTDENHVHQNEEQRWETEYYPRRVQTELEPRRFMRLPKSLNAIYVETCEAFNSDLRLLCAAGLRALIEGVCQDNGIVTGDLKQKITQLKTTGLLPANIADNLHELRFMGNDAVHNLSAPKRDELWLGVDICEDILNYLYDLLYSLESKTMWLAESRKRHNPLPFPHARR